MSAYLFFHEKECSFEDPHPAHFWGEILLDPNEIIPARFRGTAEQYRYGWGTRHTRACSGLGSAAVEQD
jgi:hypothetical protein